jgi:hypothetical protein
MLAQLFATIRPRPLAPAAAAPQAGWPVIAPGAPADDGAAHAAGGLPASETAHRFRALAECCADGLTALAYAQFADLLELSPPVRRRAPGN